MKKSLLAFLLVGLFGSCQFFIEDESNFDCQLPPVFDEPADWSMEVISLPPIPLTQYSLFFLDENVGFILDPIDKAVWKTSNTGNSWVKLAELSQISGSPKSSFPFLFFFDSENGLVVQDSVDCPTGCTGFYRLFKISDGQLNPLPTTGWSPGFIQGIHFLNENEGFANISTFNPLKGAYVPVFKKTVDGGQNWSVVAEVETAGSFMQWLPDGKSGFVSGTGDRIYKTDDGGQTWKFTSPGLPGLADFIWTNAKTGFVAHQNGVVATTDGGDIWTHMGETPMALFCADSAALLGRARPDCIGQQDDFIDEDFFLFFTADGGVTWATSRMPLNDFLNPIQKLKPGLAIARGNYGPYLIRRK